MKYPVNTLILDELGQSFTETVGDIPQALTFKILAARGLINEPADTKPEEKVERYDLYRKVKASTNDTDFSVTEVALMRKASLIAFKSLIAGQLAAILDQKA